MILCHHGAAEAHRGPSLFFVCRGDGRQTKRILLENRISRFSRNYVLLCTTNVQFLEIL
jgi:hypothetical protein